MRWWDGQVWSEEVAGRGATEARRGEVATVAPAVRPAPASRAATVAGAVGGLARGSVGAQDWQVVVGPSLPSFAALGGPATSGVGRLLGRAPLLAITTVLAVVPAMLTDTPGAGTLGVARLVTGLLAAGAAALLPRLRGAGRIVARLLPIVFVVLQLVAVGTTAWAWVEGESSASAALPYLIGGAATVVAALRALRSGPPRR